MQETISKTKIGVIGAGSWATAIMKMLCYNVDCVNWFVRNEQVAKHLNLYGHNPSYLSAVVFDKEKINIQTDVTETIKQSDVLIIATPAAFLCKLFEDVDATLLKDKIVFSAVKGMIPEYHAIPARFIHKSFRTPYENIGIISGPCHAEEVALERLSYLTLACSKQENAELMAQLLACRFIKTSVSDDIFGTELSAVLKNIFAVAAGICHGLGYGDNFQAVLVSNAIQEIERFVDAVHPIHRDVKSSAYLGDLLVTAYSQFSRNRTFGNMIGKGYSVRSAQMEMNMVAEGYFAVKSVVEVNKKFKVDMPITDAVYRILYEKVSVYLEMQLLADKLS